jgi:hypothetical protein
VVPVTAVPEDVQDRLLWLGAQKVLDQHLPYPTLEPPYPGEQSCAACGKHYPCWAQRMATEAQHLARQPWPAAEPWHDPERSLAEFMPDHGRSPWQR